MNEPSQQQSTDFTRLAESRKKGLQMHSGVGPAVQSFRDSYCASSAATWLYQRYFPHLSSMYPDTIPRMSETIPTPQRPANNGTLC